MLKTAGRFDDCVAAYRKSISLNPAFGEAYWSLANMKTFCFTEADLAAMREQLADPELGDEHRWHFHFALGKAYEDAADYARSFEHYEQGNALFSATHGFDADKNRMRVERLMKDFDAEYFAQRSNVGCDARDPIFIVGMPRSGSTLLEQILACHSQVEGTSELPDMITLAQELREQASSEDIPAYASVLATKSADEIRPKGGLPIPDVAERVDVAEG